MALGGTLNIRNMSPHARHPVALRADHFSLSVTGPNGAKVASDLGCFSDYNTDGKYVDYVGNGVYTVNLTTYNASCATPTGHADHSPSRSPPPPRSPRPPPRS